MKFVFDDRQLLHNPSEYFRRGEIVGHPEQPERAKLIREKLLTMGHIEVAPRDHGLSPIYGVHDKGYVDFLLQAWSLWASATSGEKAAVPNYHPGRRLSRPPEGIFGKLGYYVADTGCPIVEGSADAIYWSAQSAVEAAKQVVSGDEPVVYALCRPPGHHAYSDQANGFCFFNNTAIAAQVLRERWGRVAVIDIDTHGGNGTQDIFYRRGDVYFVSLHVDPKNYPPYYSGYPDEIGEGPGHGANLNVLLEPGDNEETILLRLARAKDALSSFGADALVISLGVDMSQDDPLSLVNMTEQGFYQAGRSLRQLGLPTVIIQEGGYLGPSLATNVATFLNGFEQS